MQKYHTPVMLNEALSHLLIQPSGFYIDCTLGEGGHSQEIYNRLFPDGLLLSIDQDQQAISFVQEYYKELFAQILKNKAKPRWELRNSNFSELKRFAKELGRQPNGILMDLGISSRQLEQMRGFSFQEEEAALDMRMDDKLGVTASDMLKVLNESELIKLFRMYGEEKHARQIAKAIKATPQINTVGELNAIIRRAVPAAVRQKSKHPSMRVFQALRIAVNDELNSLRTAMEESVEILASKGRLVVITFHSLEDRITKEFFVFAAKQGLGNIIDVDLHPTDQEVYENPRARSAKIRVFEKA